MPLRKLILAAGCAVVAMLALSHLWHSLMADFYTVHSPLQRDAPVERFIGLGYLLLAGLMALVYPKGYEGGPPVMEGLRFGALVGILISLPHGLIQYGMDGSHTGTLLLADTAWHTVEQAAGGIAVALVHGPGPSLKHEPHA
jgi:hypothetical protein